MGHQNNIMEEGNSWSSSSEPVRAAPLRASFWSVDELNATDTGYDVVAGRSNVGLNTGIINDYPEELDLPQAPQDGVLVFKAHKGTLILTGDTSNDPPLFALPGAGEGRSWRLAV